MFAVKAVEQSEFLKDPDNTCWNVNYQCACTSQGCYADTSRNISVVLQ